MIGYHERGKMSTTFLDWKFSPYVFAYGTLKYGFSNNYILEEGGSVLIGTKVTRDYFELHRNDHYPYAVLESISNQGQAYQIRGVLWLLSNSRLLGNLDCLEGHPDLFYRSPIYLMGFDNPVWCYQIPHKVRPGLLSNVINGAYQWDQ